MLRRANLAGDADCVWLDDRRRYRLSLNAADQALELRLDGVSHLLCHIKDDADLSQLALGVAVAPASLSLQSIIQLHQSTGHPVLLAEDGRILGVCGETEIIRALASGRHTSVALR
jgi:glycine betaine/proline transport system ATP-binding protein